MFKDRVYGWLDAALDQGIPEHDFWEMTLAELERAMRSAARRRKAALQERAQMDWRLANLIRCDKFPGTVDAAYPWLFEEEAKAADDMEEERRAEASAARFRQFAETFNRRFKEVKTHEERTA